MIDTVIIKVQAGSGGKGVVSFRREKGIPRGGPDGGSGGDGGSVYLEGTPQLATLAAFRHRQAFGAVPGGNGRGKKMSGRNADDLVVLVPCGTVVWRVWDGKEEELLGDVVQAGVRELVARGGGGGRGNASFATPTRRDPYIAEGGDPGQELTLRLELRLLADVGIIGRPNAGKSTLLRMATAARPKVAAYPFTTIEPELGVVDTGEATFIMAEIPGLIAGAHEGAGLGLEFLRHATRTRLLLHVVDGCSPNLQDAIDEVDVELKAYGGGLDEKPQIVVVNKVDLPEVAERRHELERAVAQVGRQAYFISAATGEGVQELMAEVSARVERARQAEARVSQQNALPTRHVAGRRRQRRATVMVSDGVYVVDDNRAARLVGGTDVRRWVARVQLKAELARRGVSRALEEAGVAKGDRVRFGDVELEW